MKALKISLVSTDCVLLGLQPILVHMSKVDGRFAYSPVSVNLLTEICKVLFAVALLLAQARWPSKFGDDRVLLNYKELSRAARSNIMLAVPALLYAINNYLKFVMQLYFKPATVKMLGNLKVLTIAILLKLVMKRRFSVLQWEALTLLIVGISINQLNCGSSIMSTSSSAAQDSVSWQGWMYTCLSVTIPSAASVFNERALKQNFETSVHVQNLFMYLYGAIFNFLGLLVVLALQPQVSVFAGHSTITMLLVANNAAQGILSSFFFKFADTILKKYSSTVATILTGFASAIIFHHPLTVNFCIGIIVVSISMHQFFSETTKQKQKAHGSNINLPYVAMAHGSNEPIDYDMSVAEVRTLGVAEPGCPELTWLGASQAHHKKMEQVSMLPTHMQWQGSSVNSKMAV